MFRGLDQALKAMRVTWRFMGSYEWVYKSLIWGISIVTLLITLLITTLEPPSRASERPSDSSLRQHSAKTSGRIQKGRSPRSLI